MEEIKLDVKDRKILYQLEKNCRQPISLISKEVGLSREVVDYRIKNLEKNGVISHYALIIDFVRLGLMFCRTFFRYNNVSEKTEEQMLQFLKKDPYVAWIGMGDGDINMGVAYITNNVNLLQENYISFLYKFASFFKYHGVSFAFQMYHFFNSYLYTSSDRTPLILGKTKEVVKIDKTDYKILLELMNDSKISSFDLSKKVKISLKTLGNRINLLIEKKIILGFRAQINARILNLEHHKIFLFLREVSKEKLDALINYITQMKEVIYITIPFGSSELEFELIVKGNLDLFKLMRALSLNFPDIIRDYEDAYLYRWPKVSYIPRIEF